ncbi:MULTISPECIES: hypothetical protein [unclassified Mycobacterium]|uniref:hypothetical protein n=1 Tax=unclassified Mycobacterium TaxID=2642494 RepID=UPI0029C879F4|nr:MULTISPECIES: hypothetical protein [unclassified Mycobacterium]
MSGFVRNHFTAGVAAAAATALVLSPTGIPSPNPPAPADAARSVELTAAVKPLVLEPLSTRQLETARAAIGRLDPDAARALPVAAAAPAPQNAASDWITAGYQWIQGWVDYGVALSQYVLQFIPYGYLIGDQVGIIYYQLVRPISDSVVYDLVVPVVNDPLNIWSWINGAVAVGQATVVSLINTGIAEFNYFFGWLIPPIPPLPLAAEPATLKVAEVEAPTEPVVEEPTTPDVALAAEPDAAAPTTPATPDETSTVEVAATVEVTADAEKSETTTSAGTVQAQGEVRTGPQTTSHQTTTADEPTADEPSEVPSDPKPGASEVTDTTAADEADAPEKPSASASDDKGGDDKGDKGKDETPAPSD